jgi:hypothetical protein
MTPLRDGTADLPDSKVSSAVFQRTGCTHWVGPRRKMTAVGAVLARIAKSRQAADLTALSLDPDATEASAERCLCGGYCTIPNFLFCALIRRR